MRPRQIKSRICGKKPAQSPAGHRLPAADPKMRRRPRLSAAFCLLCFLGMTGCTPGASVDTLLKPPSLSAEQQQIYLALQDAVGSGITLQYPRAGENLSAFTVTDLDADGEDEALVFYQKTNLSAAENGLRIDVLDQVEDTWRSVCDMPADGTEVERVVIAPLGDAGQNEILIGYNNVDQSEKSLSVYSYETETMEQIFSVNYTMFDVADMDGDTAKELLVLNKTTENGAASAAMYRQEGGAVNLVGKLDLRTGFSEFSQVLYGKRPGETDGIFIDGISGTATLQTEVLCVKDGTLAYVLADADTVSKTARSAGYLSMDLMGNGEIVIPVQEPFPGYAADASEQVRMTRFLGVSGSALKEVGRGYFSLNDGCIFLLPLSWYGSVTAVTDTLTGDIKFCRYDGEIHDHMTELLRYGVAQEKEETEDRESEGYQLLRTRGKASYYMLAAETEDALALPWQDLMTQFLFVS